MSNKRPAEAQEAAWVADEDRFFLQQSKKKAAVRVKAGRAQPIDMLAVALIVMEPDSHAGGLEEEMEYLQSLSLDPEAVFEDLSESELQVLEKGVEGFEALETSRANLEFWGVCPVLLARQNKANADRLPGNESHH